MNKPLNPVQASALKRALSRLDEQTLKEKLGSRVAAQEALLAIRLLEKNLTAAGH